MRWSCLLAVIGLSITQTVSFAQRQPVDEGSESSRSSLPDDAFFSHGGFVRFQLIQGRLCLDAPRHRKGRRVRTQDGFSEQVTVTARGGIPSVQYRCSTASHSLTLNVDAATEVSIESIDHRTNERAVLTQPGIGKIEWTLTRRDLIDRHAGTTLLHVRNANPKGFDHHFDWLVRRMLSGRSLEQITGEVKLAISQTLASQDETLSMESFLDCIEQLGSARRSTRVAAKRQLLQWGTPVIPMIHSLSIKELEEEQRQAIRLTVARLRPMTSDTASSLAQILQNDRAYWNRDRDRLSATQLAEICDHMQRIGLQPLEAESNPDGKPNARVATARR